MRSTAPSHAVARRALHSFRLGRLAVLGLAAMTFACRGTTTQGAAPSLVLRPSFAALEARVGAAPSGLARDADLVHLSLDLTFDWERRAVHGAATSWFRALRPATSELRLSATDIEVREVLDAAGRALAWRLEDDALIVTLVKPLALGEEEPLRVVYAARPADGLTFSEGPPEAGFAPEIHARGFPGRNRHWIPTLDAPGDRTTFDARLRVGHDMTVVASGELLETIEHGNGERTFVWRMADPVPVSALGFAAARFESTTAQVEGLAVRVHLPPGAAADAASATFGATPEALRFFSERLARAYPFARYDQVVVHGLALRAFESATASLFDDSVLVADARAADDLADPPRRIVTHELAHHWFGIHVTPLDLRERWLSEAFATWLELEFEAHVDGRDAADVLYEELREELLGHAASTSSHHDDVPAHYYTKGPWLLRTIAGLIGDEGLWRIARALVIERGGGSVTTEDLRRVALEVTGYDLGPLLEQWTGGAVVPRLDVTVTLLPGGGARLAAGRAGATLASDRSLRFELPVEYVLADATRVRRVVHLDAGARVVTEWFGAEVVDVVIDPDGRVCAGLRVQKPLSAWLRQASPTSTAAARWRAVEPLAALAPRDVGALQGLLTMLLEEPEAGVRRRILERLVSEDPRLVPVVMRVLEADPAPRVRRLAARALLQLHARGAFPREPALLQRLLRLRQGETSPAVRAALDQLLALVA